MAAASAPALASDTLVMASPFEVTSPVDVNSVPAKVTVCPYDLLELLAVMESAFWPTVSVPL